MLFEGIGLVENTVASGMNEIAANTYERLIFAAKKFQEYSIAIDGSSCRSGTAFCAVFVRGVEK